MGIVYNLNIRKRTCPFSISHHPAPKRFTGPKKLSEKNRKFLKSLGLRLR